MLDRVGPMLICSHLKFETLRWEQFINDFFRVWSENWYGSRGRNREKFPPRGFSLLSLVYGGSECSRRTVLLTDARIEPTDDS